MSAPDLPNHIVIKKSEMPLAGRGAFTTIDLPADTLLGEYTGDIISKQEADNKKENRYFMGVKDESGQLLHIIDGSNEGVAGWVRYINTAYNRETANVFPRTIDKRVYYYTNREIPQNSELLTYYGDEYTAKLIEKVQSLGV